MANSIAKKFLGGDTSAKTKKGFDKKTKARELSEDEKEAVMNEIASVFATDIDNQPTTLLNVGNEIFEIALPITKVSKLKSKVNKTIAKRNTDLITAFATVTKTICPLAFATKLSKVFYDIRDKDGKEVYTYTKLKKEAGNIVRNENMDTQLLAYSLHPRLADESLKVCDNLLEMLEEIEGESLYNIEDLTTLKSDYYPLYQKVIKAKAIAEMLDIEFNELKQWIEQHKKYILGVLEQATFSNTEIEALNAHMAMIYEKQTLTMIYERARELVDIQRELQLHTRGGVADIFTMKSQAGWSDGNSPTFNDNRQVNITTSTIANAQKLLDSHND